MEIALAEESNLERAQARRRELEQFIKSSLKEGIDYDVRHTGDKKSKTGEPEKKVLLKPGAEKLADFLNLSVDMNREVATESFEGIGLFHYIYRCTLLNRKTGDFWVGDGSCNSKEKKYRWKTYFESECPKEIKETARRETRKSKKDGKPYVVYITENPDTFELANTILKMAQKRAFVCAVLIASNTSEFFTQDLEDDPDKDKPATKPPENPRFVAEVMALLDAFEDIGEEPPEIQDPVESVPPERMKEFYGLLLKTFRERCQQVVDRAEEITGQPYLIKDETGKFFPLPSLVKQVQLARLTINEEGYI